MSYKSEAVRLSTAFAGRLSRMVGKKCSCPACGERFAFFLPFSLERWRSSVTRTLHTVGSDVFRFRCPACGAHDRERHLMLYFDALDLWSRFDGARVLHIAPERKLRERIENLRVKQYVAADLFPADDTIQRVDVTDIQFEDGAFDVVICNHVLEHVPDDRAAMRELRRVLASGGIAVLQTPYSTRLESAIEDPGVDDDDARWLLFGQEDHVRLYGRDLFTRLADAGFTLDVKGHHEALAPYSAEQFGVNPREDLLLVRAP